MDPDTTIFIVFIGVVIIGTVVMSIYNDQIMNEPPRKNDDEFDHGEEY